MSVEGAGRVLWKLRMLFEGGMGSGSFEKTSSKVGDGSRGIYPTHLVIQQVPYPIANISAQPTQIVLVSKRGDIITLDRDLNISNELSRDDNGDLFLRSFSYPAARCAFLPNDIQPLGEILALFLARKGTIRVRVVHLDQGGGVVQIASVELSFDTVSRIQPMAALVLSFCR